MADAPTVERNELLLREATKLMGMLFIGRREAKAVFSRGQWIAKREKFTLSDFRSHLFGDRCLGAYLLDRDSMVRCIAFDVDLLSDNPVPGEPGQRRGAPWYPIHDLADDGAVGELDLELRRGDLEKALHDPDDEAHRWACSLVQSAVMMIKDKVYETLGLVSTVIVTGGGAHVFVPFGELIPAAEGRAMAHSVMDGLTNFHRKSESFYTNSLDDPSIDIEVFPKQDFLTDPESLGNLIRLPFGMHECGMRTYALSPKATLIPSWSLPKMNSMDCLRLAAACVNLEWQVVE
jgi:hypothetical protein